MVRAAENTHIAGGPWPAVIHRLRRKAGLSQGQLAGLAGLSEDYISGMERGIQCGSLTAMLHIAAAA